MLDDLTSTDDPWLDISRRVRDERTRLGLTRQQLATRVGVSRNTIFNWESGRRIPIAKCAPLALALEVPPDDLLALHPDIPAVTAPAPTATAPTTTTLERLSRHERPVDDPDEAETLRFTRREILYLGIGVIALLVGIGFASWSTANAGCFEIGAGYPSVARDFRSAYDAAGGRSRAGCGDGDVYKWGPGMRQDLSGGSLGDAVILGQEGRSAIVLAGQAWLDYDWLVHGAAAAVAGYPDGSPRICGDTLILMLTDGRSGPGALVQAHDATHFAWIGGRAWATYAAAGGPLGPLGAPIESVQTNDGWAVTFASATITAPYDAATAITPSDLAPSVTAATPFVATQCASVDATRLAAP